MREWRLPGGVGSARTSLGPMGLFSFALALTQPACSGAEPESSAAGPSSAAPASMDAVPGSHAAVDGNSLPADLDDETSPEDAKSVVNVWQFSNLTMSTRFVHYYQPPSASAPSMITLLYGARDKAGRSIVLEWPYDGNEVSYSYSDLTVAPSYVAFRNESEQRGWRVTTGDVSLVPQVNGHVRVELAGLEIAEQLNVGEGPSEGISNGFVTGEVERVCVEYVIPTENIIIDGSTGQPFPQAQRDDDWSSPFCAQFGP